MKRRERVVLVLGAVFFIVGGILWYPIFAGTLLIGALWLIARGHLDRAWGTSFAFSAAITVALLLSERHPHHGVPARIFTGLVICVALAVFIRALMNLGVVLARRNPDRTEPK